MSSLLSEALDAALRDVPARRHIQSFVVAHEGEVQLERYFRDRRATDLSNVHSVTKSVVATLAGLAIRNGSLAFETRLDDLVDESLFRGDEQKRRISIEHLLTMTAGLDADTPHDIDEIADRDDSWIAGPLAAPLLAEPGTRFSYNNGAAHVLGAAIARATETPLVRFADEQLFKPLGVCDYRWPTDPGGNALGYGHLELRPCDLLRIGLLYLDGGRWNGLQLLPESFVAAATTPHSAGGPPEGTSYGYLWWITEDGGYRSFFAGSSSRVPATSSPRRRATCADS
jgi:CubicO group peptidase (beta-lactamase class C family)